MDVNQVKNAQAVLEACTALDAQSVHGLGILVVLSLVAIFLLGFIAGYIFCQEK